MECVACWLWRDRIYRRVSFHVEILLWSAFSVHFSAMPSKTRHRNYREDRTDPMLDWRDFIYWRIGSWEVAFIDSWVKPRQEEELHRKKDISFAQSRTRYCFSFFFLCRILRIWSHSLLNFFLAFSRSKRKNKSAIIEASAQLKKKRKKRRSVVQRSSRPQVRLWW